MAKVPDVPAFFREGLRHYAEASETVRYFQECVNDAIARAFETKTVWTHFEPFRADGRLDVKKTPGRIYLSAYIGGAIRSRGLEKAWMSLGLYWNPPLVGDGLSVVAAAHIVSDESGRQMLDLNHRAPGTQFSVGPLYGRRERRLLMVTTSDFDPDLSFALLLDAADEALRPDAAPAAAST